MDEYVFNPMLESIETGVVKLYNNLIQGKIIRCLDKIPEFPTRLNLVTLFMEFTVDAIEYLDLVTEEDYKKAESCIVSIMKTIGAKIQYNREIGFYIADIFDYELYQRSTYSMIWKNVFHGMILIPYPILLHLTDLMNDQSSSYKRLLNPVNIGSKMISDALNNVYQIAEVTVNFQEFPVDRGIDLTFNFIIRMKYLNSDDKYASSTTLTGERLVWDYYTEEKYSILNKTFKLDKDVTALFEKYIVYFVFYNMKKSIGESVKHIEFHTSYENKLLSIEIEDEYKTLIEN